MWPATTSLRLMWPGLPEKTDTPTPDLYSPIGLDSIGEIINSWYGERKEKKAQLLKHTNINPGIPIGVQRVRSNRTILDRIETRAGNGLENERFRGNKKSNLFTKSKRYVYRLCREKNYRFPSPPPLKFFHTPYALNGNRIITCLLMVIRLGKLFEYLRAINSCERSISVLTFNGYNISTHCVQRLKL